MRSHGLDVLQIYDGLAESEIAAILCHIGGIYLYPCSITQYNSKSQKKQLTVWANAPIFTYDEFRQQASSIFSRNSDFESIVVYRMRSFLETNPN